MKLLTKDTHVVHRRQIRVGFNCDNRGGSILKIMIGKNCEKKSEKKNILKMCLTCGRAVAHASTDAKSAN